MMMFAMVNAALVMTACGGSNEDGTETIGSDKSSEYLKKLEGNWNLISRVHDYSDGKSTSDDFTYYKLVLKFSADKSFTKEIYDYSVSKKPITSDSEITNTVKGTYMIQKTSDNKYVLSLYFSIGSASYYIIDFRSNDRELRLDETNNSSNYMSNHEVYEKIG